MSDTQTQPSQPESAREQIGSSETGSVAKAPATDQLAYIADLILELKGMSRQLEAGTLATILKLAYAEAQLELRRRGG